MGVHHGGLSTKFVPIKTQIGGYIGSLYLCKNITPHLFLALCTSDYSNVINFALDYLYPLTKNSSEWRQELNNLRKRIENEL